MANARRIPAFDIFLYPCNVGDAYASVVLCKVGVYCIRLPLRYVEVVANHLNLVRPRALTDASRHSYWYEHEEVTR